MCSLIFGEDITGSNSIINIESSIKQRRDMGVPNLKPLIGLSLYGLR